MKKVLALVVVLSAALLISGMTFAANNTTSGPSIAVVDLARALNEVNEGKKAKANLEKEFQTKKSSLEGLKNEIQALRDDLEKNSHLLSQEALKEKSENYQRKFLDYQQKAKEFTEELARKEGEMTGKIVGKLRTVVAEIAQKDGYTFVLEKSQGGVVYGPQNADITDQVIKSYNK